jgi:hypothetical protein
VIISPDFITLLFLLYNIYNGNYSGVNCRVGGGKRIKVLINVCAITRNSVWSLLGKVAESRVKRVKLKFLDEILSTHFFYFQRIRRIRRIRNVRRLRDVVEMAKMATMSTMSTLSTATMTTTTTMISVFSMRQTSKRHEPSYVGETLSRLLRTSKRQTKGDVGRSRGGGAGRRGRRR